VKSAVSEEATESGARAIFALGLGIAAYGVLESLIVPILPVIQRDLGTDAVGISWALTATLVTAAVSTPLLGRVGDLYGKRRVFLALLLTTAIGSLISAAAPSLGVLIAGRALQGIGAGILPLAFGLARDAFPHRVAWAVGILSSLTAVGALVGTVLSGPLTDLVHWRGLFVLPLVAVAVSAALVARVVPDGSQRAPGRINVRSAVLLSLWLVAFLVPLSLGGDHGWLSPGVIGSFLVAAVALAGWIVSELHADEPLVDLRMMRLPGVWNTNLAALLLGASMFGLWASYARFLQEPRSTGYGLGATVAEAGLLMLPMLFLMAVGGAATDRLGRWLGMRVLLAASAVVIAVCTTSLALFHDSRWDFAVIGAVVGFGFGTANAVTASMVVQSVPATHSGVAGGMNANFRKIGQAIGVTVITAIITGVSGAAQEISERGYVVGFLVLAAIGLLAVPATLIGGAAHPRAVAEADVVLQTAAEAV
jgi:MFS family permease